MESRPGPAATGMDLGDRLVARGIITEEQLRQAGEVQKRSQGFLGQILVDLGYVTSVQMGTLLARDLGVPYVDLLSVRPDPGAVRLVPEHVLREAKAIPIGVNGDGLHLAMLDPLDVAAIDNIHLITGRRVVPCLAMAWELQRTLNDYFDIRRVSIAGSTIDPTGKRNTQTERSLRSTMSPDDETVAIGARRLSPSLRLDRYGLPQPLAFYVEILNARDGSLIAKWQIRKTSHSRQRES